MCSFAGRRVYHTRRCGDQFAYNASSQSIQQRRCAALVHVRETQRSRRYRHAAFVACLSLVFLASGTAPDAETREAAALAEFLAGLDSRPVRPAFSVQRTYSPYAANSHPPSTRVALQTVVAEARSEHTRSLAQLLVGLRVDDAAARLTAYASTVGGADQWNDVAAAHLLLAETHHSAESALEALVAADNAIAANPRHAQARFNRVMALVGLGLDTEARSETKSLAFAPGWSREAASIIPQPFVAGRRAWQKAIPDFERAVMEGRREEVAKLIDRYPEHARAWGEGFYLGVWADDPAPMQKSHALQFARAIAFRLEETTGERMLADAIRTIVAAEKDSGRFTELARAHRMYRDGRRAHAEGRYEDGEELFRRAARIFRDAGSPMSEVAEYYIGSSLFVQYRLREARTVLAAVAARRPASRGYRALAASLGWEYGLVERVLGSISDANDILRNASAHAAAIGDRDKAAVLNVFLAGSLDILDDPRDAWDLRAPAFRYLSAAGQDRRVVVGLASAAATRMRRQELPEARSLLDIAAAMAMRMEDAEIATYIAARRAVVLGRLGDSAGSQLRFAEAARWNARVNDTSARKRAAAEVALARASIAAPKEAIRELTAALDYYEAGTPAEAPPILLDRARLYSRLGDEPAARADRLRAIATLEQRRALIRDFEQRARFLTAADALFAEATASAIHSGDIAEAFDLSERQRARTIAERLSLLDQPREPERIGDVQRALAADAAIVTYIEANDAVVGIVVRRDGWAAVPLPLGAREIAARATSFALRLDAIDQASALAELGRMHEVAVRPLLAYLKAARNVVWIPSKAVADVPVAALYDARSARFVFEQFRCMIAPSASSAIRASTRARRGIGGRVLSAGASTFDGALELEPLPHVAAEARQVAALHPGATLLLGPDVTENQLVRQMRDASVVNFAGHGIEANRFRDAALVVAPDRDRGLMKASRIATLDLPYTDLAVLTSCRSAHTRERVDGPENLAWAFLMAGVPTVVAARWPVDDAAGAAFGVRFHRELRTTRDPLTAYHSTMRILARDASGQITHPRRWAMFVMLGGSPSVIFDVRGAIHSKGALCRPVRSRTEKRSQTH